MRKVFVAALWSLTILTACAPVSPTKTSNLLQTPSGRPEVTIKGATRKQFLAVLVPHMLSLRFDQGDADPWQVKQINEFSAVFGSRVRTIGGSLFFGSRYDSYPEARMTFNFVDVVDGIQVFGNVGMVTNPGSAFEKVTDMTAGQGAQEVQSTLELMRGKLQR